MRLSRSVPAALALALLSSSFTAPPAAAAADAGPIKIAVITDLSGVYASLAGAGAVDATKMAVEDFGGKVLGRPIVVDAVDHRNQGPEGATKAREEFASGADLALDMTNSGVALAVAAVAKEKHKLAIVTGGGTSDLTGSACNKYTYHYSYDTYALAHSTGSYIAEHGGKKWYGIAPNYAFGKSMDGDFRDAVSVAKQSWVKTDFMPLGTTDFSSYMIAAKNSGADVLALLNAGADTVNSMKAAKQFGLDKTMKIAVGLLFLSDVDAQPALFANSRITTSWYWNQDKAARAWADRWSKRNKGLRPTSIQAADYSAAMQWLEAVKAVKSTDADKVVKYLDGRSFSDFYAHSATWQDRDHLVTHEMLVVDVLPESEIKEPHGWYKIVEKIAPGRAFRPETQTLCKKDW
ncbi:MAG TPA: ABC transporter substrate-binding protein [Candidatus Elarobacter sp.]|jgi:branched-chain amino acid transport system substrate-binding protein